MFFHYKIALFDKLCVLSLCMKFQYRYLKHTVFHIKTDVIIEN